MPISLLLHGKHAGRTPVTYEPLGPWIVPTHLGDPAREYEALRHGVGLVDYSTQAVIELQGADRGEFLHRLLSNSVRGLNPGEGCRAALLTPSAKLIADLVVLADAASHWLVCDVTRASVTRETLEKYLFSEDVRIMPHERRLAALALQGPRTLEIATELFPVLAPFSSPYAHQSTSAGPAEIRLIRWQVTGQPGLLMLVLADALESTWLWLQERGAAHGVVPVGWAALNICRIEAGVPWFDLDMDESNLLPETGLERIAASDSKGCYIGQEIVARMATYGSANKKLVGLRFDGESAPQRGDDVRRGDEPVGTITSACVSPVLHQAIALAVVKRGAYDESAQVSVAREGTSLAATVAPRPFLPELTVE